MGLFIKRKKAAESCESAALDAAPSVSLTGLGVKVLGTGCAKCKAFEASVNEALASLGALEKAEHVTDLGEIAAYGAMGMPALVVRGKVVSSGRVLRAREAAALIKKALE